MFDKYNLEIKNFRRINNANIEINKINVVGGVNASGKSTASKLLYCFLKANSPNGDKYVLPKVISNLNLLIKDVDCPNVEYYKIPDRLSLDADRFDVINEYQKYKDKFQIIENSFDKSQYSRLKFVETLIESLKDKTNIASSYALSRLLSYESLTTFLYQNQKSNINLNTFIKFYSDSLESIIQNDTEKSIKEQSIVYEDYFDWHDNEFYYLTKGSSVNIPDVFYIGTLSLFDLENYINSPDLSDEYLNVNYEEHMASLINNLNKINHKIQVSDKIIGIQKTIESMIQGNFQDEGFVYDFSFSSDEDVVMYPVNISSGIKQIGILQMLLKNNKLIPGSVLIIDEPEVNLHPEWQFKFAEILVLLAKDLDIIIYLNSHSPMFIEAVEVLTQYYDLEEYTNFYMTEKQDENTYDFVKVDYDNLYDLYDNLAKPYDVIEAYRLKAEYKKGNY